MGGQGECLSWEGHGCKKIIGGNGGDGLGEQGTRNGDLYQGQSPLVWGGPPRVTFTKGSFAGWAWPSLGSRNLQLQPARLSPTEEEIRMGFGPGRGSGAVIWGLVPGQDPDSISGVEGNGCRWRTEVLGCPAPGGKDSPGQGLPRDSC